ncbi:MAG: CARDB domain-containing protein [Chitinophagaceae bacterium]
MKHVSIIIFSFLCFSTILSAQKTQMTVKKPDTVKVQTLNVKPENSYVRSPAPLPDLRLSALSFTLVNTQVINGVTQHTFQINYTVSNDGTQSVAANAVFLQGYISYSGTTPKTSAGCGSVMTTLQGEMINAGATRTGWFRCTASFDRNNPPLYRLFIDSDNSVKESNEENNSAQMTIIF